MRTIKRVYPTVVAFLLSLAMASPVFADPAPQLVRQVQQRLDLMGIPATVDRYDTATVAALHLALVGGEKRIEKLRRIRTILADPGYKGDDT